MKGKFIVFYGINNLGKSTQTRILIEKLKERGISAEYLKYAVYDLEPSGPILNGYLRNGNPYNLTAKEFQIMQIVNRTQYESILKEKLNSGVWIIAEDYVGTGIAWGAGAGVDKNFLIRANQHLLQEDLSLFFHGKRFSQGIEANHVHEQDDPLTEKVASVHEELADMYGWRRIFANRPKEDVANEVWQEVVHFL